MGTVARVNIGSQDIGLGVTINESGSMGIMRPGHIILTAIIIGIGNSTLSNLFSGTKLTRAEQLSCVNSSLSAS